MLKYLKRINSKINTINLFTPLVDPSDDIPEQRKPTLIILGPQHYANPDSVNGNTKPVILKLATKKGNSDRIYRNTILFLICSEIGISKLQKDISEYLACDKIRSEYQSQLEHDQKEEIRKKIEEYSKLVNNSLVSAYSIVVKYSATKGIEKLILKQFKDSLDLQINATLIERLKNEEWLLESVGLGTLRKNNLFPTIDNPVKAKDIYEAFLRFDDKPMINNIYAVQDSLLRYCINGEYAIATGEPGNFNKIYYKEPVPFFDVSDTTYWLVDKSLYKVPEETTKPNVEENPDGTNGDKDKPSQPEPEDKDQAYKSFKTITISGRVDVANYPQLFTSFIMPLRDNQVEIEIKIKGKTTKVNTNIRKQPAI